MKQSKMVKGFLVVENVPDFWIKNESATTTPVGYEMWTNGKSLFSGERQRVLIKNKIDK